MRETLPDTTDSPEQFLEDLQRWNAENPDRSYPMPHFLVGATVLAKSVDGDPIINRGILRYFYDDDTYDYCTDGNKPLVDTAAGELFTPFFEGPSYMIQLYAEEGRFFKRQVEYIVPLLRDGELVVDLTMIPPEK